jgi:hypothetical protein
MKETNTMSDSTTHALKNLERYSELDSRTAYIIKILIQAELPCREYDSADYLDKLADAVHNLWNHLCQLDTGNLAAWDIGVWELASLYGAANGARTFPREEKDAACIAAAPDLLAALDSMVFVVERMLTDAGGPTAATGGWGEKSYYGGVEKRLKKAKEAIAKAKGGE